MEITKTVSMFVSTVFVGACIMSMPANASERGFAFKGAIVSGGCNTPSSAELGQLKLALDKVSGQIALDSAGFRSVCGGQILPLEARYVESSSVAANGHGNVITLTYQ